VTLEVALEVAPKEVRRLPRPPLAAPAGAAGPHARPRVQLRGYEHTNHLTQEQAGAFRTIVDTYIPDLHDPAAVEVLLVLLEVCHILEVSDYRMRKIFGARQLHALATWGDIVPPKQRPPQLQRAWVWAPNTYQPKLYPIAADGTVRVYIREEPDADTEADAGSETDAGAGTDA
jgi:hypothetical protein